MTNKPVNPTYLFEKDHVNSYAYHTELFTKEECNFIINYCNSLEKTPAIIGANSFDENTRKSNVAWITPNEVIYPLYQKLHNTIEDLNNRFFKFDLIGFCEGLQFTEYIAPTGHYKHHVDAMLGMQIRKLSIVLQLTNPSDYEGGDLEIYEQTDPLIMNKQQGTLILFPSYKLHRVTPVTKGVRHSLVAWITGPNFR
jgi:PKHD-type hydroxylase